MNSERIGVTPRRDRVPGAGTARADDAEAEDVRRKPAGKAHE